VGRLNKVVTRLRLWEKGDADDNDDVWAGSWCGFSRDREIYLLLGVIEQT
jgi:hypothetical protein